MKHTNTQQKQAQAFTVVNRALSSHHGKHCLNRGNSMALALKGAVINKCKG